MTFEPDPRMKIKLEVIPVKRFRKTKAVCPALRFWLCATAYTPAVRETLVFALLDKKNQ